MSTLASVPLTTLSGAPTSLADYAGKVLLIVNVASKCGLTPQYTALEALYQQYKDRGLVVLGFPSNDFAEQEPGTAEEIAAFCSINYPVTFPIFSKISVNGPSPHPPTPPPLPPPPPPPARRRSPTPSLPATTPTTPSPARASPPLPPPPPF